jgi:crossover junction endodeoxyribonuclease RusA
MSAPIVVRLPWVKPPLTGNRTRGNPYARAAEVKNAGEAAEWVIRNGIDSGTCRPIVGAEVTLHYRPKDKRRRDADGMFPTLKACLDALVRCGVLPDDSWVCVPAATCRIHPPLSDVEMWLELTDVTDYEETTP